jgi:hypothetical protein
MKKLNSIFKSFLEFFSTLVKRKEVTSKPDDNNICTDDIIKGDRNSRIFCFKRIYNIHIPIIFNPPKSKHREDDTITY